MSLTFSIHFKGTLLPGHTPEQAKADLAALLRISAAQCEAFFCGVEVVIRRAVPAGKLPIYLKRLAEIGLEVEAVPEVTAAPKLSANPEPELAAASVPAQLAPVATDLVPPAPEPLETAAALTEAIAVEEIICPKCAERQPKRTLCRVCSIDMPRYAGGRNTPPASPTYNPYASTSTSQEALVDVAESGLPQLRWLSFSLNGRIGRMDYATANLLYMSLLCFCGSLLAWSNGAFLGVLLAILLALVGIAWGLRIGVLRMHDLGWSGWLTLLQLVPFVGSVFGLVLAFKAGQDEDNDWGATSESLGGKRCIASALLCLACFGLLTHATREIDPAIAGADEYSGPTGFVAVPMPASVPKNTILLVVPESADFEQYQRSQTLSDKLASHNLKVLMQSSVALPESAADPKAQADLDSLREMLSGEPPIVFIAGKARANPSFAQVRKEFAASQ